MNRTLISAVVTAGLAALYFGDLSLLSSFLRCVFLVFTVLFYIVLTTLMVIIFKLWTQQPVFEGYPRTPDSSEGLIPRAIICYMGIDPYVLFF